MLQATSEDAQPVDQDPSTLRPFRLTRAYSLASLLGILGVAVVMALFYRQVAVNALMDVQNEANADLTRAFADAIWDRYAPFFATAASLDRNALTAHQETMDLREELRLRTRGMRVVKIKIYNLAGLTLFSTDPSQIGESKADNPGFRGARAGEIVSNITFRDRFDAFDRVLENRDLLSSYLPVRRGDQPHVVGVFELYTDITTLLARIHRTELTIVALIATLMLALYLFLLVFVRRADGVIRRHEADQLARQQERIQYLSQHDTLTGMPNRKGLLGLLEPMLQRTRGMHAPVAVVYIDLDRFKLINDHLGHEAGDRILIEIAGRISLFAKPRDIVGRIGGDEFVLVAEDTPAAAAQALARKLTGELGEPFRPQSTDIGMSVSVGIALSPDGDADQLLKHAEAAMLRAKELGRNRYAFFTDELNARELERFELERGLRAAVTNREFELHFQPRVDTASGRTVGAEALLRWRRADGELLLPAVFVPLLEEMDLIGAVGRWVLGEACRQCRAWQQAGRGDLSVSVNLSIVQLRSKELLGQVRGALLASGLAPGSLELELSESMLVTENSAARQLFADLRKLGVHLSIDDFGTGYSSLSYLMHFPIDCLKIDRAFIRDAVASSESATLTRTIVSLAKSLNLRTVAEGVETAAHRDFLAQLGCNELQGYLFSEPLSAGDFVRFLDSASGAEQTAS